MIFFKYLLIFCIFSVVGWFLEFSYKAYKTKKIVNPGFMSGIVVPLYGFGAVILTIICNIFKNFNSSFNLIIIFFIAVVFLTILEYISGWLLLKLFNLKLWDYSQEKFNYKGLICVKFSVIWGLLSIFYYYIIYSSINSIAKYLVNNIIAVFFLGIFSGIFIIDLCISLKLLTKLKKYANLISQIIDVEKIKLESRKIIAKNRAFNSIYPYISTNRFIGDRIREYKEVKYEKK